MILTKEQLTRRGEYIRRQILKHEDGAWMSPEYTLDFIVTIDALTQTIAELTAKLDALRELADGLSQVCGDWGRSEGISKRILAILDAPTKPKDAEWQCEVCHSRYAEYVNGCPHCWEAGLRSKVTKPKEARNGEE